MNCLVVLFFVFVCVVLLNRDEENIIIKSVI